MSSHRSPKPRRRSGPYEAIAISAIVVIAIGIVLFTGGADHEPGEAAVAAPLVDRQPHPVRHRAGHHKAKRHVVRTRVVPTPVPTATPTPTPTPTPAPERFTLTAKAVGPGSVNLCHGRNSCSRTYEAGTEVNAHPRVGKRGRFDRWEGCLARCRIAMTRDRTITAHFLRAKQTMTWTGAGNRTRRDRGGLATLVPLPPVTLTLSVVGSGAVTVDGGTGGVIAGDTPCADPNHCTESFDHGSPLTLVALPAPGFTFAGWDGCPEAVGNTCELTLTLDRTVTAHFEALAP